MPSRRSSVKLVTLHTSAPTPKSVGEQLRRRPAPRAGSCPSPAAATLAPSLGGCASRYMPAQDALLGALRHRRVLVVLVHQREVVEDVLLLADHPPQAVADDHRDLVAVGRVVGDAVRDRRAQQVRVAVLVLQALAVERRAPGGAAEQEPARAAVAGGPGEVADPLEAEHRVVDVERDRRDAVVGVRRARGDPGGHRAGLVDALLEHLAVLVLAVEHQLVAVLGRVELADLAEDAELAEHALHAERARLVGHDRDDVLADLLVAQDRREDPDERHRRRDLAVAGAVELALERGQLRASAATRALRRRAGSEPPSAARRSRMNSTSGESSGGL